LIRPSLPSSIMSYISSSSVRVTPSLTRAALSCCASRLPHENKSAFRSSFRSMSITSSKLLMTGKMFRAINYLNSTKSTVLLLLMSMTFKYDSISLVVILTPKTVSSNGSSYLLMDWLLSLSALVNTYLSSFSSYGGNSSYSFPISMV
jgi:hypothetical protein